MKKILSLLFIVMIAFTSNAVDYKQAPPSALGMPGDNLNLYVVLNLFKQANSTEHFEQMLNSGDYKTNNLDLNNDGNIDYLRVTDYGNGNYHTIVIQDIISASEIQDVAIIDLQKQNGDVAHIQIIGDESLYGKDYIIEPQLDNTSNNTTIVNNNYYYNNQTPIQYVNVWSWPCVSFIFNPGYNVWVSPWHWAYYPTWWNNRPRVIYTVYNNYFNDFGWNNYCRRNTYYNQTYYNNYYQQRRVVSNTVKVNIEKDVYKNNYGKPNQNNGNHYGNNNNNGNHYGNNKPNKSYNNNTNNQQGNNSQGKNQNNGNWNSNGQNQQKPSTNTSNNNAQQQPKWNNNNSNNGNKGNWNSNNQNKPTNTNQNSPRVNNGTKNNGSTNQQYNKGGNANNSGKVKTGTRSK